MATIAVETSVMAGLSESRGLKRGLEDVEPQEPSKKLKESPEIDLDDGEDSDSNASDDSFTDHSTIPDSTSTPATPASHGKNWRPFVFYCPRDDCDRVFNRPCRLAEHMRSHTNERPYTCPHEGCDKTFRRDTHLSRHITSAHTDERKFACRWPGCGKRFVSGTRMRRHYETHEHNERFRCTAYPPCTETFRKHKTLQSHITAVHLGKKPWPCTHIDEGTGEQCDRAYDTEGKLRSHKARAHSGLLPFECALCGAKGVPGEEENTTPRFATHAALKEHLRAAHPPRCEECKKTFKTQWELANHVDQKHTDPSERTMYPCPEPECGKLFGQRNNLKEHVRTVHKGEKRFTCGVTDVSGSKKFEEEDKHGNVTRHEWDNGNGCQRSFGTKATLEEHIRTQHLKLTGSVKAKKELQKERSGRDLDAVKKLGKRVGGAGVRARSRKAAALDPNDAAWQYGQIQAPRSEVMPVGKWYIGGAGEQYGADTIAAEVASGFVNGGYEYLEAPGDESTLDPTLQYLDLEA